MLQKGYLVNMNTIHSYQSRSFLYNTNFCSKISLPQKVIDIKARGKYPSCTLSNLSDTKFIFDGVQINSIEGFLQSLKVPDIKKQKDICKLSGFDAKKLSKSLKQSKNDTLFFWQGQSFKKDSVEFKTLINDVIQTYKNTSDRPFKYKGYDVYSVNTFINALKSKDIQIQKKLSATPEAESTSKTQKFSVSYSPRTLYWQGKEFKRDSKEYNDLLNRVYEARFNADEKFKKAIIDTEDSQLTHRKGHTDSSQTILTTQEFLSHLKNLRNLINK